jgi:hypothetical protein
MRRKWLTIGIEPPQPMKTAGFGHSSLSACRAAAKAGPSDGSTVARDPAASRLPKRTEQSGGRAALT